MNQDYYYQFIVPFISMKDRKMCSRRDRCFLGAKNKNMMIRNAYVFIHQGSPCYKFCICRYFQPDDIVRIYMEERKMHSA